MKKFLIIFCCLLMVAGAAAFSNIQAKRVIIKDALMVGDGADTKIMIVNGKIAWVGPDGILYAFGIVDGVMVLLDSESNILQQWK